MENPMLLTVKQATQELQLSVPTIRMLIKEGVLPSVRFGSSVRIPRKALERYIEHCAELSLREKEE